MSFCIKLDCPQCGAPLEMEDTDRLLRCNFCNVQNFLGNTGPLHFILPRRQPDPHTIYAPYYRFKGTIYSCLQDRIEHRLADLSTKGVGLPFLPRSLGLRPQAMKMHFATPEFSGSFLKTSVSTENILKRAAKNRSSPGGAILHQAFIGHALNIIYLPLSIKDEEILDGVMESFLAKIPHEATPFAGAETESHPWRPSFLAALCPQCGWNLAGEPDSVVLFCTNCATGWQAGGGSFSEVRTKVTPAPADTTLFIPFWNYRLRAEGIKLDSFADFIRITNLALVIKPEWEDMDMHIISPAFKVRPDDFLRLGSQITAGQRYGMQTTESIPTENLHPVTLGHRDAAHGLKVILANSAVCRHTVFPHLGEIRLEIKDYFLHYLPFKKTSHEFLQTRLGITINQRVLNYGRSL